MVRIKCPWGYTPRGIEMAQVGGRSDPSYVWNLNITYTMPKLIGWRPNTQMMVFRDEVIWRLLELDYDNMRLWIALIGLIPLCKRQYGSYEHIVR